jgi:hypothetical protein
VSASGQTEAARRRFFNEGIEVPPFVQTGWRGCLLDRSAFDATRMPSFLFEAIVAASGAQRIHVCCQAAIGVTIDECTTIPAHWPAYREFVFSPEGYSPRVVVFDDSGQWALLLDEDATLFGASPRLADAIDAQLVRNGTDLRALTRGHYGDVPRSDLSAYVDAVMAGTPGVAGCHSPQVAVRRQISGLDARRQERYRVLLSMAMLDIRSYCQSRSDPSPDPEEHAAQYHRSRIAGAIADWLHELAEQSARDFEHFDEAEFWGTFEWIRSRYPDEGLERYRQLFDQGMPDEDRWQ